jgi:alpha-tubulin suppressor-like RCC1 family protein
LVVFGQLGHNSTDDELIPRLVMTFIDNKNKIVDIRCGTFYTMAVTSKGEVFSWGHGEVRFFFLFFVSLFVVYFSFLLTGISMVNMVVLKTMKIGIKEVKKIRSKKTGFIQFQEQ